MSLVQGKENGGGTDAPENFSGVLCYAPENARGIAKFNVLLARMMFAGANFIIIPSTFEPYRLIQLQGMGYGVVPICSLTGGLVDTDEEGATGFHMGSFNVEQLND